MAHRRSIFLINKPFQYRFCFYVCTWLLALSAVYPVLIYNLFGEFLRLASLDPFGPPVADLLARRKEVLGVLVTFQLVFAVATFLISIFVSHRIAGPLFKLSRFMQAAKNGNLKEKCVFRKGDHFQDLAEQYNDMAGGLRGIFEKNTDRVSTAIGRIESTLNSADPQSKQQLEGALAALREVQQSVHV